MGGGGLPAPQILPRLPGVLGPPGTLAPTDTAETVSDHSQIGNEKSGQNAHNFLHVSDGCFLKWSGHISTRFIETSQF